MYKVTRESTTKGYQQWYYDTKEEACRAVGRLATFAMNIDPTGTWKFTITEQ